MKAYFLWTVSGPQMILTSFDLNKDANGLTWIANEGITKFMAYEVSIDLVKERYGERFEVVAKDPNQTDKLRFLDTEGRRVLNSIHFAELGTQINHESGT